MICFWMCIDYINNISYIGLIFWEQKVTPAENSECHSKPGLKLYYATVAAIVMAFWTMQTMISPYICSIWSGSAPLTTELLNFQSEKKESVLLKLNDWWVYFRNLAETDFNTVSYWLIWQVKFYIETSQIVLHRPWKRPYKGLMSLIWYFLRLHLFSNKKKWIWNWYTFAGILHFKRRLIFSLCAVYNC